MAAPRRNQDRIAARTRGLFAGREAEVARLRALATDPGGPLVVLVHGAGGIGKTHLVHVALDGMPAPGARFLDCRAVEPTPAGLAAALGCGPDPPAIGDRLGRGTLVLDAYEHFLLMDAWLRRDLVPAMVPGSRLVTVGRDRPSAAWFATPGWAGLAERVEVGPLAAPGARTMLALRGVTGAGAERLVRFAGGNPLALELGALTLREGTLPDDPPAELLAGLVQAFLAGLDGPTVDAVEAAAVPRRVTEPLLAELLGRGARGDFARLRALPFTEDADPGLALQEAVREAVAGDLARRDPERLGAMRRIAAAAAVRALEVADGPLWAATADALFLVADPIVHDAFFARGAIARACEPAGPGDMDAVRALVATADPAGERALLARWVARHPEALTVVRGADGRGVDAVLLMGELAALDPGLVAGDPVAAAVAAHIRRRPVRPGERVLLTRALLVAAEAQEPAGAAAALWLDIKRTYIALRPALRRVYVAVPTAAAVEGALAPLGFAPVGRPVRDGGARTHIWLLDFGPGSVDGWLAGLIGADEPGAAPDHPAVRALTAREREVLTLLAAGLTNREVAERLVISEKTAGRHVENLYAKLGVHRRAEAARIAAEAGLAPEGPPS